MFSTFIKHILNKLDVIRDDGLKIAPVLNAGFVRSGKDKITVRKTIKDGSTYWRPYTNMIGLPGYIVRDRKIDSYVCAQDQVGVLPLLDEHSSFLTNWGVASLILLIATAFLTPYQVAFIPITKLDIMFLIDRLFDIAFFFDMGVQFCTAYEDPKTDQTVRNHQKIAINYLTSWFLPDLVSTIPFDMIPLFITNANASQDLDALHVLRLVRLLKLFRILRANRKLKHLITRLNVSFMTINIIKSLVFLLMLIHLFGCGWKYFGDGVTDGWVLASQKFHNGDNFTIYILCVVWAIKNMSLQGASGFPFDCTSLREYLYQYIISLLSYVIAIFLLSYFGSEFVHRRKEDVKHEKALDHYKKMFRILHLNSKHQRKVQKYWTEYQTIETITSFGKSLGELPIGTKAVLTLDLFGSFVASLPYIASELKEDPTILVDLCSSMQIRACPPSEILFAQGFEGVYFITKGVVGYNGRVYSSGSTLGVDCLRTHLLKTQAVALTFTTIYFLPKKALIEAIEKREEVMEETRRWLLRRCLRQYVLQYTTLYLRYSKIGARLNPPKLSQRPNMTEGEFDEIDVLVTDIMNENGF